MNDEPILQVRGLKKSYGALTVLKNIDLTVHQGYVTFLVVPSGVVKSTLLRCINFLARPNGGEIRFDGQRLCHDEPGHFRVAPEKMLRHARSEMQCGQHAVAGGGELAHDHVAGLLTTEC